MADLGWTPQNATAKIVRRMAQNPARPIQPQKSAARHQKRSRLRDLHPHRLGRCSYVGAVAHRLSRNQPPVLQFGPFERAAGALERRLMVFLPLSTFSFRPKL